MIGFLVFIGVTLWGAAGLGVGILIGRVVEARDAQVPNGGAP